MNVYFQDRLFSCISPWHTLAVAHDGLCAVSLDPSLRSWQTRHPEPCACGLRCRPQGYSGSGWDAHERMRIRRLCPPRSQILLHHVVPSYSCFPGYCASRRPLLLPPLVYLKVCRTESAVLPTPGRVSHCKEIIFWTFCPYLDRTVKVKLTGVTLGIQAATHHIWPKWWPQELEKKKKKNNNNNTSVPVSCMNTSDWLQKGVSGRTGLEECFRRTAQVD